MSVRPKLLSAAVCALLMCGCAHDADPWFDGEAQIAASSEGSVKDESYVDATPVDIEGAGGDSHPIPVAASRFDIPEFSPAVITPAEPDAPYTLDTGDRLRIFVYGQPNLSRQYTVDHDGRIAVPLIGDVFARGKTTRELQGAIRARLGAEFVKDPQVTVDVQQNRPFFIYGEVRAAGQYPYVSGMTVETAIAIAGGYSERASDGSFRITRRVNGFAEQIEAPGDIGVRPGDTIYVFERFF